jgi:hypothetical protein
MNQKSEFAFENAICVINVADYWAKSQVREISDDFNESQQKNMKTNNFFYRFGFISPQKMWKFTFLVGQSDECLFLWKFVFFLKN